MVSVLNFVPEKNRIYHRRFDHEEALARRAAGESVAELAAEYGVTTTAIYKITPEAKARDLRRHREWRWRDSSCEVCGKPAMRVVQGKAVNNPDGRCLCRRCRADEKRERLRFDELGELGAVRCSNLDCANGQRWQQPENFPRGTRHREVREGGIHSQCRACGTRAKRLYRAAHPEYNRRQNAARKARGSA